MASFQDLEKNGGRQNTTTGSESTAWHSDDEMPETLISYCKPDLGHEEIEATDQGHQDDLKRQYVSTRFQTKTSANVNSPKDPSSQVQATI